MDTLFHRGVWLISNSHFYLTFCQDQHREFIHGLRMRVGAQRGWLFYPFRTYVPIYFNTLQYSAANTTDYWKGLKSMVN